MRSTGPLAAIAVTALIFTLAGCTGAAPDAPDTSSAGWTALEQGS